MSNSKDLKFTYRELKNKKDITIEDINSSCFIVKETKPQIYYIIESPRKKPRELKITDLRREFPMLKFGKLFNPIKAAPSTLENLRLKRIELNNEYTKEEIENQPIKLKDNICTYGIDKKLIEYDVKLLYALLTDKRTDEKHKALCINFIGAKYPTFFYFDSKFDNHPMDYLNNYGSLGHKPINFNMFKSDFISRDYSDYKFDSIANGFSGDFFFYIHDCEFDNLFEKI